MRRVIPTETFNVGESVYDSNKGLEYGKGMIIKKLQNGLYRVVWRDRNGNAWTDEVRKSVLTKM